MKRILKKISVFLLVVVIVFSSVTVSYEKSVSAEPITTTFALTGLAKVVLTLATCFGGIWIGNTVYDTDGYQEFADNVSTAFKAQLASGQYINSDSVAGVTMTQEDMNAVSAEFDAMINSTASGVRGVSDEFNACWKAFCAQVRDQLDWEAGIADGTISPPVNGVIETTESNCNAYTGGGGVVNLRYHQDDPRGIYFEVEQAATISKTPNVLMALVGYSGILGYVYSNANASGGYSSVSYFSGYRTYWSNGNLYSENEWIQMMGNIGVLESFSTTLPLFNDLASAVAYVTTGQGLENSLNYDWTTANQPESVLPNTGGLTSGHGYDWAGVNDHMYEGVGYTDALTGEYVGVRGWDWIISRAWEAYLTGAITWEQLMAYTHSVAIDKAGVYDPTIDGVRVDPTAVVLDIPDVLVGDWPYEKTDDDTIPATPVIDIPISGPVGLGGVLTSIFPFCIPFDLIFLIESLQAEPEPPHWEIPFDIDSIGYHDVIVIDFAQFEPVAEVCRTVFTVLYILILILLSRKLIKG